MINFTEEKTNFRKLLQGNPRLQNILQVLNSNNIRYGLYAGSYVFIVTSNRLPTDVDILIHDRDFKRLEELFQNSLLNNLNDANFFYPYRDRKIEFMANANVHIEASRYKFRLTDLAWRNTSSLNVDGYEIRLCNPVDTILLKAMLQRGFYEDKHDLEDIEILREKVKLKKTYLTKRLSETNSDSRVLNVLKKFKFI